MLQSETTPKCPRSSQSPLQRPLRPRSSQSPLQSALRPRSSQRPLRSRSSQRPLRSRSSQSPHQRPLRFRSSHSTALQAPAGPVRLSRAPAGPIRLSRAPAGPVRLSRAPAGPAKFTFVSAGPAQLTFVSAGPAPLTFSAGSVQFSAFRAPPRLSASSAPSRLWSSPRKLFWGGHLPTDPQSHLIHHGCPRPRIFYGHLESSLPRSLRLYVLSLCLLCFSFL